MYYKNLNIEDLQGELWESIIDYDGVYSASNLGRIKSENRFVNNGKSERLVKSRILSQALSKDGRLTVNLSYLNKSKTKQVNQLVFYSFNKEIINDNLKDEVFHINKIDSDNRLINLGYNKIKGCSYNISIALGNVKHRPQTIGLKSKHTREYGIFKNGILTKKKCKKCCKVKNISLFEISRNTCIKCRSIEKKQRYELSKSDS